MDTPVATDSKQTPAALNPVINCLDCAFSEQALKQILPINGNVGTIKKDGSLVTVSREQASSVPLTSDFLNGSIKLDSIKMANDVTFEIDPATKTASNITGVSLNLTLFGDPYGIDVTKIRLGEDADGQKTLFTELRNPLCEPGRRVAGMPPSFSVEIPVTAEGLKAPRLSKVFADAAATTGPSIAGLLASDALNEASKVALFVESNPQWVNHVVEPALQDILRHLVTQPGPRVSEAPPSARQVVQPQRPGASFAGGHPAADLIIKAKDVQPAPAVPAVRDITKPGDYVMQMEVGGATRSYHVHVPPSYNGKTPMPLVLLLHGHAQNGKIIAEATKFDQMSDREGFIAVYPDARTWAGREEWRAWDTDNGLIPPGEKADDVKFLRQIIEQAESDYKVDPKRIYMAGLSNGGMMSFRAAGELSDKLAAIAVVSGAMSGSEPPPKSPVSVLNIHGTEDGIVPYDGLKNVPASLTAIGLPRFKPMSYATDFWVDQNKITNPPLVLKNNNITERRFINAETGAEVNEYTIHGGYHVPHNIDELTGQIWKFFASHPKSTGNASGTLQAPGEQPFNITKRLQTHAQTRGLKGLQLDAGQMLGEVSYLGNGSVSPSQAIGQFERQSGVQLRDTISLFLKSTNTVTKQGQRISFEMSSPQKIAIGRGSDSFEVKSLNVDNSSFNLLADKNQTALTDISGLSVDINALGRDMNVPVREVAQKIDGNGDPYYRVKAQHPSGSFSRALMLADKEIPIELKIDQEGNTSLINRREMTDATLGVNPVLRGYIDIGRHGHSMYTQPSWGAGLHLAKDVGIMGGSSYGAWKLASHLKYGTRGKAGAAVAVGVIVAPAVIHGVERLLDR